MRSTRTRHLPFENIKCILIKHWAKIFNRSHDGIWNVDDGINGLGEGACLALIKMKGKEKYEGKFSPIYSQHAEMNAIFGNDILTRCREIESIEITSPPCPCCAVVLESLELSDKVITRQVPIRRAQSYNMSKGDFMSIIEKVVPKELHEDAIHHIDSVYSLFASGEWYDIANTKGLIK